MGLLGSQKRRFVYAGTPEEAAAHLDLSLTSMAGIIDGRVEGLRVSVGRLDDRPAGRFRGRLRREGGRTVLAGRFYHSSWLWLGLILVGVAPGLLQAWRNLQVGSGSLLSWAVPVLLVLGWPLFVWWLTDRRDTRFEGDEVLAFLRETFEEER